ncbi:MAG: hypothetical protein EOM08_02585 [Clostridia bacterium]|nr:hypothetical protein [Clostridia bacterium]
MTLWIFILGLAVGWLANLWARRLVLARQPDARLPAWLAQWPAVALAWPLAGAAGCQLLAISARSDLEVFVFALWLVALLALSATDLAIRKIPNDTLLLLLLAQIARLATGFSLQGLGQSLVGLVTGYFFFSLPALFGKPIGRGDIKLAAVIGFCLGPAGTLQSIAVMGLFSGLYFLLLILTRRGNLKSKVPIGPILSIGMLVSVQFPLVDKMSIF